MAKLRGLIYDTINSQMGLWVNDVEVARWNATDDGAGGGSATQAMTLPGRGTVTQATSKSTGATLNATSGSITMNGAALLAGVEVTFVLTNSAVAANDVVFVHHASAGTSGAYMSQCTATAAGTCDITVSNLSAGSLSEAIVLNFMVFKSAT